MCAWGSLEVGTEKGLANGRLEPLLKSVQVASDSQAFHLGGELQGLG